MPKPLVPLLKPAAVAAIPMQTAAEPWVDIHAVARHLNFGHSKTRKMVTEGKIPGCPVRSGRRTYWRFRISAVDAAMQATQNPQPQVS